MDSLRLFVDAASLKSMAASAERAGLSPSAATRRIAALEHEIGSRLFVRSTRLIELTEAGRALMEWAARALGELEATRDAINALQRRPEGLVRIACPEFIATQYLPPFVAGMCERYPGIVISLITTDRTVNLAGEHFDLAIHAGDQPEGFLIGRKLWDIDIVMCATPAYLRRFGTPQRPSELADHRCITHSLYNPRDWLFEIDGEVVAQPVAAVAQSSSTMLLRSLAMADIGIVRTTRRMVAEDLKRELLVEILSSFAPRPGGAEALETWIIFPERQILQRTRIVIDELTRFLTVSDRSRRGVDHLSVGSTHSSA